MRRGFEQDGESCMQSEGSEETENARVRRGNGSRGSEWERERVGWERIWVVGFGLAVLNGFG